MAKYDLGDIVSFRYVESHGELFDKVFFVTHTPTLTLHLFASKTERDAWLENDGNRT